VSGGSPLKTPSGENLHLSDRRTCHVPGVCAAIQRQSKNAGGQRAAISKPASRNQGPLSVWRYSMRRSPAKSACMDCPCRACRYMALAPGDLSGRDV
ncbi:MAG: hypothetical protein OXF73_13445, partial [Gammaproteobacteria bacterium]|nr:hypothetical protein [Gammaproteobacteria bacterium]